MADNSLKGTWSIDPSSGIRWQFAQAKSIRLMCICCSLSLRKRKKHGKTMTAHVKSKVHHVEGCCMSSGASSEVLADPFG